MSGHQEASGLLVSFERRAGTGKAQRHKFQYRNGRVSHGDSCLIRLWSSLACRPARQGVNWLATSGAQTMPETLIKMRFSAENICFFFLSLLLSLSMLKRFIFAFDLISDREPAPGKSIAMEVLPVGPTIRKRRPRRNTSGELPENIPCLVNAP